MPFVLARGMSQVDTRLLEKEAIEQCKVINIASGRKLTHISVQNTGGGGTCGVKSLKRDAEGKTIWCVCPHATLSPLWLPTHPRKHIHILGCPTPKAI